MKKLLKVLTAVFVCMVVLANVFALSINDVDKPFNSTSQVIGGVEITVGKAWATIIVVVQVLAIAAVVFAGVRNMFASADTKADIKKSMGMLAAGAILVFAATTVIRFVVNVGKRAFTTTM